MAEPFVERCAQLSIRSNLPSSMFPPATIGAIYRVAVLVLMLMTKRDRRASSMRSADSADPATANGVCRIDGWIDDSDELRTGVPQPFPQIAVAPLPSARSCPARHHEGRARP